MLHRCRVFAELQTLPRDSVKLRTPDASQTVTVAGVGST